MKALVGGTTMKNSKLFFICLNLFLLISGNVFAEEFSSQCPDKFQVEVSHIQSVAMNAKIQNSPFLSHAYNSFKTVTSIKKTFSILTRTKESLCVYNTESQSAFLQLNNGKPELDVGVSPYSYLRIPLTSFNKEELIIKNSSALTEILAADYEMDSDGGTLFKEEAIIAKGTQGSLKVITSSSQK